MSDKLNKLKHDLRGVSIFDKIRASIFKYPSSMGDTCELYDQWLCDFLNSGVIAVTTTMHDMTLKSDDGRVVMFWVANYPYSYGNRSDVPSSHAHWYIYPSWSLAIRLRKLQLESKEKMIDDYRNKMLSK